MQLAEPSPLTRQSAREQKFQFVFRWRFPMPLRVLLADDHVLVRQGLKSLLEREGFQVVGDASDGQEALRLATSLQPDIAVMDISMPILNGLNTAREMSRSSPKIKTILLTQHEESQYVSEAMEAGVKGYVLKNQIAGDLVFQHVSLDARFHSFGDVLTFFVLSQENGLDLWRRSAHFPCGIQSIQYGHTDIHYRDVRLEGGGKTKGLLPIGCVGNNLKTLTLQQGLEALANEDVVISKQDAKWHGKPPSEDELKLLFPGRLPSQWRGFRQLHLAVPACRSSPGLWVCR